MHIRTSGQGPVAILIHGWASSGRIMEPLALALEDRFEVRVIDLPGHGAQGGRTDPSLDDLIAAAQAEVDAAPTPPLVIGWAMGGLIALALAGRRKLRGAVCIGTASGGAELGPVFEKMASRMGRDWPRYVRSSVDAIVGERVSPEMHRALCTMMEATSPRLARHTLIEVGRTDAVPLAADAACPVLFAHGEQDAISPPDVARRLAAAAPQARLRLYPDVGHAPFLEKRETFLADLDAFLETLDD